MDSWLYDGDPLMHLEYQETFDFLKQAVEEGYFEGLIRQYLLDNPHEAVILVTPEPGKTEREDEQLANMLAERKASMTPEAIDAVVQGTRELREYQEEPSSQENLEKIPMLGREDISRQGTKLQYTVREEAGVTVLHTDLFTSGIGYLKILFNTDRVPVEDLPYVGLLKAVLGYVDTEQHTYGDLSSEIFLNSGGLDFSVTSFVDLENRGQFTGAFVVNAKVLYEKLDFVFHTVTEILTCSKLDNEKRLGEILDEVKSRSRMRLDDSAHAAAVSRASSYFSPTSAFNEMVGGIGYYHFLEDVAKRYGSEPGYRKELIAKLKETITRLFTADNLLVGYTADQEGYAVLRRELGAFKASLPAGEQARYPFAFEPGNRNEGFMTASQVNYVARCGTFAGSGYAYTGALKVLKVIMNYEYLWSNLRVKGGAYGCMSSVGASTEGYFVSYRDPNLAGTNAVYEGIPEYLRNFSIEERDMTKYVIGTISDIDAPMSPAIRGSRSVSAYLSHVTDEMIQKEREEVLDVTQEDIRGLAGIIQAVLDTGALCVVGNGQKIREDEALFKNIQNLYH